MRSVSKTKTETAGVEVPFHSRFATLRNQKLADVERRDDVAKVPTCGSEEKEIEGLQIANDLILNLPWKSEEGG